VLSLQDSQQAAPTKVLGDITAKIPPNGQEISDAPTKARPTAHKQKSFFEPFLKNKVPMLLNLKQQATPHFFPSRSS
jgi:hypothetical protein